MSRRRFTSWLALPFERFIALKRAGGARYDTQSRHLTRFDHYVQQQAPELPLGRDAMLDYLKTLGTLSPRARDNVISVVWQALSHARRHGASVEPLLPRPPSAPLSHRVRSPRLLSPGEMQAILAAARQLPKNRLRPATHATLFGLLWSTGMRIGEALALDVGDIDSVSGVLTIRKGKFGKSRVLPLRPSTLEALSRYVHDPRRPIRAAATAPLFVSCLRRRLSRPAATFRKVSLAAGVSQPVPRLHDIRHSFAVYRVATWYAAGRDVNALLPALSTYLGHVCVEHTRVYLRANGRLFEHACQRFADATKILDEVLS